MELKTADEPECLPLREVPHSSRLFLDYVSRSSSLLPFYPSLKLTGKPADFAPQIHYDDQRRGRVADALERQNRAMGCGDATLKNLERFRRGAYVVVSGQQAGLLGGSLLSMLKAAHAVRLARDLTSQGMETVPVFWVASEDHDFAEVNHAFIPRSDHSLVRVTAEADGPDGAPMSGRRLTAQVEDVLDSVAALLGDSQAIDLLRECYRSGETMASAFEKLFTQLFAPHGLVLLDPADTELHEIAKPLFLRAVTEASDLAKALQERGRELERAGYHEQVKVTGSSVLLFAVRNGVRLSIQRQNAHFSVGGNKLTEQELVAQVERAPQDFNANVLLRPVMQDYLLPTLAYIGGPAEVAYFAQGSVVHQRFLGRVTPVLPRFSASIVEARIQKLMRRYALNIKDLFGGADALAEKIARDNLPSDLESTFQHASELVAQSMGGVSEALQTLDPTLVEAARRAASKMKYQVERLHRRAARATLRRSELFAAHAQELVDALYPEKALQERTVAGIYFLAKYGLDLVDTLIEKADACPEHRILRP